MAIQANHSVSHSVPRFQGISIVHYRPQDEPLILIRGSKAQTPYGIDAIDLNSAVIARSEQVGDLCRRLESGETVSEPTIRTVLKDVFGRRVFRRDPLDYSVQENFQNADFSKTMRDYFNALRSSIFRVSQEKPVEFYPENHPDRSLNDVYVALGSGQ